MRNLVFAAAMLIETDAMSFPTWPDLAKRLPSAVEPSAPSVYDAVTTDAASLSGKTVLYRDQQGWCPYIERLWLALEVKNADYVTVLVDEDFTMPPGCDTVCGGGSMSPVLPTCFCAKFSGSTAKSTPSWPAFSM